MDDLDSVDCLVEGIRGQNGRAISRAISLVENSAEKSSEIISRIFKHTGSSVVVGVTGAPGSGKSTLVDSLAVEWRKAGKRVAVLAVDPSSPFSGGAVLGDRIRMANAAEDGSIFIRSIATRGALGGLCKAASDVVCVLDAAGFDVIIVETVGVGQAEVDIVRLADTCLVVMVPGFGDSVQAIKAGVLEIADIFVVNKSDRDGADMVEKDLRSMVSLVETPIGSWETAILRTVATKGEGAAEVISMVNKHRKWLQDSGAGKTRQEQMMKEAIIQRVRYLAEVKALEEVSLNGFVKACVDRTMTPIEAARRLV